MIQQQALLEKQQLLSEERLSHQAILEEAEKVLENWEVGGRTEGHETESIVNSCCEPLKAFGCD